MITWDVSPEIVSFGFLKLRWYGLFFAISFLLSFRILARVFKQEGKPEQDLDQLLVYMMVGTIVGARLGHCLFYEPETYLRHPIEILKIWNGGLASHGAAIGILISSFLYSAKRPSQPWFWLLDRIAMCVALSGVFIRLGNLMNSEIIGKPTDLPWAFIFKRVDEIPRHPTQIYESLSYLAIFGLLYTLYWRKKEKTPPGSLVGIFMILVFLARFLLEFLKEPQVGFEKSLPLNMGQFLSIPFILLGIFLWVRTWLPGTQASSTN